MQQELAEILWGVPVDDLPGDHGNHARLARAMRPFTPTAQELPSDEQLIVDGTLVSCWSWEDHPELHSGKHHTTGLNLPVVCDLTGQLRWISEPIEGCRHDSTALRRSGVLDRVDTHNRIGDKGYLDLGMITPIRKPFAPRPSRLGKRIQHRPQQNPLENRTNDREPENLENPPHRLPPTTRNLHGHHQRRHRATVLPDRLNWPLCFESTMRTRTATAADSHPRSPSVVIAHRDIQSR